MNLREITIGQYRLIHKDTDTNGTMTNNVNAHKRAFTVSRRDVITTAGKDPLSRCKTDSLFPYTPDRQTGTCGKVRIILFFVGPVSSFFCYLVEVNL